MSQSADPATLLPTFSVVIPNYNHGHYLEAALHAHLGQSVPPLEIIVVDDASTDDSCAVVERMAANHPRVRLVQLPQNGGVNPAINRGLHEARGDYVHVSAADDLVMPGFAARSLAVVAAHPDAGLCFSDPAVTKGDSGAVYPLPLALSPHPCLFSPAEFERHCRWLFFTMPTNTVLYRRAPLLAAAGFVEELRWWADMFASCTVGFRHGACYVPEVLAVVRVLTSSYSQLGLRDTAGQRDALHRMVDLLDSPSYRDVAPAFRASALLPHPPRYRSLLWLLASPRHRRYLTPRLVTRVVVWGSWRVLKPCIPQMVRLAVRRLVYRWRQGPGPGPGGSDVAGAT
ncbi:MAG: glycosyltransferase family 2 protein [Gemmatimonadota bacterium]